MSEKFVVGQWVTRNGVNWKVKEVGTDGDTLMLEGYGSAYADVCFLFLWQVGRTYRTTLDGVTATVDRVDHSRVVACMSNGSCLAFLKTTGELWPHHEKGHWPTHLLPYLADEPPPESDAAGVGHDIKTLIFESLGEASMCWSETPRGVFDSDKAVEVGERLVKALRSKLFPLPTIPIADEDAATFSEFEDADECNPQPAVPSSTENKIAGIYCCDVVQYFNFNIGSAITSLWTCDVGTNADDAMLSLKAAAWFVQREIERRAKR